MVFVQFRKDRWGRQFAPPPQKKKLGSMSKLAPKTSFYLKSQQFKSIMDLFYLITSFSNIFHPVDINL